QEGLPRTERIRLHEVRSDDLGHGLLALNGLRGALFPGPFARVGWRTASGPPAGVSTSGRRAAVAHQPRNRWTPARQFRPNGPPLADPSSSLPFLLFVLLPGLGPGRTSARTPYITAVENATRRTDTLFDRGVSKVGDPQDGLPAAAVAFPGDVG